MLFVLIMICNDRQTIEKTECLLREQGTMFRFRLCINSYFCSNDQKTKISITTHNYDSAYFAATFNIDIYDTKNLKY